MRNVYGIDAACASNSALTGLACINLSTGKFVAACLPFPSCSNDAECQAFYLAALWIQKMEGVTIISDCKTMVQRYENGGRGKRGINNVLKAGSKLLLPSTKLVFHNRELNKQADYVAGYSRANEFTGQGKLVGDRPPFTVTGLKPCTLEAVYKRQG